MQAVSDFSRGKVSGNILRLAMPMVVAQLVNVLYNIVDRMYIGHIPGEGAAALTGLGVCFPLIMLISAFANLIGMGGAPRASILMGHGDEKAAERITERVRQWLAQPQYGHGLPL